MTTATVNLLLVDADKAWREQVIRLIESVNPTTYTVTSVESLSSAQLAIASGHYDIALVDYYASGGSIRELLQTGRVQDGMAPAIVVFTEAFDEHVDTTAIVDGAADYLIKRDLTASSLARALRHALARRSSAKELARLAHQDPLTQIPNRMLFRDRLDYVLRSSERSGKGFALLFIDLNGFKAINDNFGHDVGDEVIRTFASRLVNCLRKSDSVARMGGDEFTLLLPETDSYTDVHRIIEKVVAAVNAPSLVNGYEIVVGCSIGVAIYPEAGRDADTLMRHADVAMYKAKEEGHNRVCFFNDRLNQDVKRQLRLESDLRVALREGQFVVKYLPRVKAEGVELVGFEARLFWQKPTGEIIPAREFIHTAQEIGLGYGLGNWVLETACRDLNMLKVCFGSQIYVSVTCSLKQFFHEDFVNQVAHIFTQYNIQPGDVEFALGEALISDDVDQMALAMRPLAFFGINFSLKHFGSSSASFLHLVRLPITSVKIEGDVFAELRRSLHEKRLIDAMIKFAHALGKHVIIDGVRTQSQLDWLRLIGCDLVQGETLGHCASIEELIQCKRLNMHQPLADLS